MRTLSTLLLLLLVTGCACGPGPRARRAVDEARAAGAETYAPGELQRALRALDEAARSEGADRDRLHEVARIAARRASERSIALQTRVTEVGTQLVAQAEARSEESIVAADVVLAAARAGLAHEVPLAEGVSTLTPERAAELAFSKGALLLDVRPASARRERAVGAVDAPPLVLEHTRWPHDVELVLLGSGVGNQDVANAAKTLRQRGYQKISLLSGGLRAWKAAGLPEHGSAPATDVPVVQAKELAANGADVVVVDVRDARSYAAGHVPGAVHIASEDLEVAAARQLAGHRVIVYAASDDAGRRAAERLAKAGHRDVRRLLGGVVAWARAGQRFDVAAAAAPIVSASAAGPGSSEVRP